MKYELSFKNLQSVLLAGMPGQGKTQYLLYLLLNQLIKYAPADFRIAYIDLKPLDSAYLSELPHLAAPLAIEHAQALQLIEFVRAEIDRRKNEFFHTRQKTNWYTLILVVDELRELVEDSKEMRKILASINALGRQYGVFLLSATQYPKAETIGSDLIACFATKVCLAVGSAQQSRTILDDPAAYGLPKLKAIIKPNGIPGIHELKIDKRSSYKPVIVCESALPKLCNKMIDKYGERVNLFNYSSDKPAVIETELRGDIADKIEVLREIAKQEILLSSKPVSQNWVNENLVELTGSGIGTKWRKVIAESLNQSIPVPA